ncbi:hypothetical protein [Streptomyces avermitilis]|uniref:Uncharacterized protein n=2 Tax=Streptomyces avermitilis TaxID=33903 RepID=A0A143SZJ3_STRAW|nr:hypothetical protein [Streptomyces avermitilis]BAU77595.1 hypothetical protein SAVERM_2p152 [Streptomyces avermitilis MA-4680 = NBRC 14893]GDY70262.1 hypothetical protein SAV14893_096550 [Streptomyces avermitilis]GDY80570.1 hypothetical protein SAV31267_100550 [Streptomyces avermitilis]
MVDVELVDAVFPWRYAEEAVRGEALKAEVEAERCAEKAAAAQAEDSGR